MSITYPNSVVVSRQRHHLFAVHERTPQDDGSGLLRTVKTTIWTAEATWSYVPITGGVSVESRMVRNVKEFE